MQAGFYPSVELKPANRSPIVGTARQGAAVSAGRTASTWSQSVGHNSDELFSARASGHRA